MIYALAAAYGSCVAASDTLRNVREGRLTRIRLSTGHLSTEANSQGKLYIEEAQIAEVPRIGNVSVIGYPDWTASLEGIQYEGACCATLVVGDCNPFPQWEIDSTDCH